MAARHSENQRFSYNSKLKTISDYNATGVKDDKGLGPVKIGDRPSGELPDTIPLVQRAIAATTFFGESLRFTRGSTHGTIPIAMGIPTVTLGRGGQGGGTHSQGEWCMNANGTKAIKMALLITMAEAGLGKYEPRKPLMRYLSSF